MVAHKSIVVSEYCSSMHYHQCCEFVDPSVRPSSRRLGMTVVEESYAVSHHYRSCFTARHIPAPCNKLLANTILDDTVLRYRHQLIDNVRRVLDVGILQYYNATNKLPSENATLASDPQLSQRNCATLHAIQKCRYR